MGSSPTAVKKIDLRHLAIGVPGECRPVSRVLMVEIDSDGWERRPSAPVDCDGVARV